MKLIKLIMLCGFAYGAVILFTAPNAACTKQYSLYDTTVKRDTSIRKDTLTHRDTLIRKDTVLRQDTSYDLNLGLVAYYNFNGGSMHDGSGMENNIFYTNATLTSDRFGRPNNAYQFNGTGSFMQVHNSTSLSPANITLQAIVKVNGFYLNNCHVNSIFQKGSPDAVNGFYGLRFQPQVNDCVNPADIAHEVFYGELGNNNPVGSAAGAGADSMNIQTGVWYTLTYTYDGKTANFYINGVLKSSVAKVVSFAANTDDLFIGKSPDPSANYYFNGVIDEIRIYNRALAPGAVAQLSKLVN